MKIKNPIIPINSIFIGNKNDLDYKAICVFSAIGFFLDQDTYFKNQKVLKPGFEYEIDSLNNTIISEKPYFSWHYSPIQRSFEETVLEFANLFEKIIKEQVGDKQVILPLSGGLDSRTQATALSYLGVKVKSYSYAFTNGFDETVYGKKISKICKFPFLSWKIPVGYLWKKIDDLSRMNNCYSEFTHPRQLALIEKYANLGDLFSLGHLGDLFFDDLGVSNSMSFEDQVQITIKKILKKGGLELANKLWSNWKLEGNFEVYLEQRVRELLNKIDIPDNANARIRAFKSLYWVPRWSSTNLSIFESVKPISLPYYDNRMCEFICTVPEKYLSGRQIQIAYIKLRNPKIAKITWQEKRPFNLYNYHLNKFPYNFPYKVINKLKRMFSVNKFIQRNWELQFLGKENDIELKRHLFENESFNELIPEEIVSHFYNQFKTKDAVFYSHPLSILLTVSLFTKRNSKK